MKFFITTVFLFYIAYQGSVQGKIAIIPSDVVGSLNKIVTSVGKQIPSMIPTTPSELFQLTKHLLVGLPEKTMSNAVNKICSIYMNSDSLDSRITPNVDEINFQLHTTCNKTSFPLTQAEKILESPEFDVNKKVVVFVTGWMSNVEMSYIDNMAKAYNCRGGHNFLALDTAYFLRTLYTWSAFNTKELGRILAEALEKLTEQVPVENIHLVGHSLGAHVVGYAGRYFTQSTGLSIKRITGLDPASPCFNEGESLSGLERGDASFIDIIHTNPDVLGKSNSVGDVDFYVEGLNPVKPGCLIFGCSHCRAYSYYTETVYPDHENSFMGTRCSSMSSLKSGSCKGEQFPMGYAVPYNLKGNYILGVNPKSPYGRSASGKRALSSSECGKCTT